MKSTVLGLTALFLTYFSAIAQSIPHRRDLPAVVLNAFQQRFPQAKRAEWEKKKDGVYEVEFEVGLLGRDHKVYISPDGKVLKHVKEIVSSSLPDAVRQQIKINYSRYRTGDAYKIEVDDRVTYEVELESRYGDLVVVFGVDGEVIGERMD